MKSLVSISLSLFVTVLLVPLVRCIGIIDKPNARKIHTTVVPRTGGIAIMAGLAVALSACAPFQWGGRIAIFLGAAWIVGLIDDIVELSPRLKLALEALAALAPTLSGISFHLTGSLIDPIITFLWFVGYMNAFNLIDGLDGLASSVAISQALAISVLAIVTGSFSTIGIITSALVGACIGFLFFNWHPARIFMGDSGSLLIGLAIALSGVLFQRTMPTSQAWTGIFVLGSVTLYPLFDTFLSMYRRARRGVSIFAPDRSHSYNLLVDVFGLKQPTVAWLINGVAIMVSAASIVMFTISPGSYFVVIIPILASTLGVYLTRKAGLAYVDEASMAVSKSQR